MVFSMEAVWILSFSVKIVEYRFTIGWNTLMMPTFEGEDPASLRNQDYIFTWGMYL